MVSASFLYMTMNFKAPEPSFRGFTFANVVF